MKIMFEGFKLFKFNNFNCTWTPLESVILWVGTKQKEESLSRLKSEQNRK